MKKILLTLTGLAIYTCSIAQTKDAKPYTSSFSGFVKNDIFIDTRETVNARDGHFMLWPTAIALDSVGKDINDYSSLNILAIQSRLTFRFSGPDVLGAKVNGVMEGDFFGNANTTINVFRMRHAFVKLNWEKTELISGQYWNPFFVTSCFPGTISFNTGAPYSSFARNPQIRVTHFMGKFSIMGAILSQVDNTSRGIGGTAATTYLRNAVVPEIQTQAVYETKNDSTKTGFLVGAGVSYKTIEPRTSSNVGGKIYAIEEKISSVSAICFTKITLKPITIKLQTRYGENIPDLTAPGGFAVKEIVDATTGETSYTPLTSMSYWGEIHTNGTNWEFGIFGGLYTNTGTKETMSSAANAVHGLATNIASSYRVSPRATYKINKFSICGEIEYSAALYGKDYDADYKPASTSKTANTRILLSTIYAF